MKVKKYTAKTMSEAMEKIKGELGQDAVILNSKRVEKGGFLGLFTKKNVEVIAAIDPDTQDSAKASSGKVPRQAASPRQRPVPKESQDTRKLTREIDELKQMIQSMQTSGSQQISAEEFPGYLTELNHILKDQEIHDVYRLEIMRALLKRWYQENGESQPESAILKWLQNELDQSLIDIPCGAFDYQ
ncbi:flagellar biosynthesis protein FlhF [Salisediminibacterium selenitireducens]|uniref:flagellar biosynthesis protein FlhF n=1 Tax=Salisediminibacterium selenitireducens TaxID=85683 RepID=UPI00015F9105